MKKAKKIALLLLSLVLLIGVFAVWAFAEETSDATVVYPDGSQISVAVGEKIPGVDGALCYAPKNTLYTDCTITGADVTDGIVPEGAAGQTITIAGTKVYFAVEVDGGDTAYYTNGSTAGADLHSYMYKDKDVSVALIKLYADISANITHFKGPDATWYSLDLNGHELSNTSTLCVCGKLSLYSSQAGGVYRSTNTVMFNTTNWTNNSVRIDGALQIGEKKGSEDLGYGKNLTVYCNQIVNNLGTQPSYIVGGTFVQNEGSTAAYLFSFYREDNTGNSLLQIVRNATFVITNPDTAVFHAVTNSKRTLENCTFVCTAGANAPFSVGSFNKTYIGVEVNNCAFVNVIPAYYDWVRIVMTDCSFGTNEKSVFPTANKSVSESLYLVHGTEQEEITVLGKTYVLDGEIVTGTSDALLIGFEDIGEEYWAVGSRPVKGSSEGVPEIVDLEGVNTYCQGVAFDFSGIAEIVDGVVTAAGSASAPAAYVVQEPLYFTTLANGELTYYYGDKEKNEADLIAQLKAGATLKLYADMVTAHVGTIGVGAGDYDLNGHTWTFSITSGTKITSALSAGGTVSFHSTVAGARMVLEEDAASNVWGFFYTGGASGTLNLGEAENNTTFECRCLVYSANYGAGMYIKGGTFIQNSKNTADCFIAVAGSSSRFKDCDNATFIMNNVKAFFDADRLYTGAVAEWKNNAIISAKPIPLFGKVTNAYNNTHSGIFKNTDFYNVYLAYAGTSYTAFDASCNFSLSSVNQQSTGYVAHTGEAVVKTIAGKEYTFTAKLIAASEAAFVDWGFGITECWVAGLTATHADVVIDEFFTYAFTPITLTEAGSSYEAVKKLVAIESGTLRLSLTLQSSIGLNLWINEALANATVTVGGEAVVLENSENGFFAFTKHVKPMDATQTVVIVVEIGENQHRIGMSVGAYAKKILASEVHAAAHNLTYAMAKYVEAVTGEDILDGMEMPAGYVAQELEGVAASNPEGLLKMISFKLDNTIAISIADYKEGEAFNEALEGKEVNLVLATGRSERANIENGMVVFEGLYVNEFYGEMTITLEGEGIEYKYCLANYFAAIDDDNADVINALYNYTYYADAYVESLPKV